MKRYIAISIALVACCLANAPTARAQFDLQLTVTNPTAFTAQQLGFLQTAMDEAEALWEGVVTGYQPGISLTTIPMTITGNFSVFANASPSGTTDQGGFRLSTAGRINISPTIVGDFTNWENTGIDFVDEILAHEIGHALGIGTHWVINGAYVNNTFLYTGEHGLRAYRNEFDANAAGVPVEDQGGGGRANVHWEQVFRSNEPDFDPNDPFALSPLIGITDSQGRDFALELMTGAIDPDYGEPFLSNTTIQSLRDIGFTVIPEPSTLLLSLAALSIFARRSRSV